MENTKNTQQKQYKRVDRSVSPSTREKISQALMNKPKSPEHRAAISRSLKADTGGYWSHIPPAPKDDDDGQLGMADIVL